MFEILRGSAQTETETETETKTETGTDTETDTETDVNVRTLEILFASVHTRAQTASMC